jgi:hypothetical protein
MNVSLRVDDAAARAQMERYPDKMERALRGAIEDATALLLREAQTYPEQDPGADYVRTGTLMRSWDRSPIQGTGLSLWAIVGSDDRIAPYNRYVMDDAHQARVHQERWDTIQGIALAATPQIVAMFEARVRAEL